MSFKPNFGDLNPFFGGFIYNVKLMQDCVKPECYDPD